MEFLGSGSYDCQLVLISEESGWTIRWFHTLESWSGGIGSKKESGVRILPVNLCLYNNMGCFGCVCGTC